MKKGNPLDLIPTSQETANFKGYIARSKIPPEVWDGYNLGSEDTYTMLQLGPFPAVLLAYKLGLAKGWRAAQKYGKGG